MSKELMDLSCLGAKAESDDASHLYTTTTVISSATFFSWPSIRKLNTKTRESIFLSIVYIKKISL